MPDLHLLPLSPSPSPSLSISICLSISNPSFRVLYLLLATVYTILLSTASACATVLAVSVVVLEPTSVARKSGLQLPLQSLRKLFNAGHNCGDVVCLPQRCGDPASSPLSRACVPPYSFPRHWFSPKGKHNCTKPAAVRSAAIVGRSRSLAVTCHVLIMMSPVSRGDPNGKSWSSYVARNGRPDQFAV